MVGCLSSLFSLKLYLLGFQVTSVYQVSNMDFSDYKTEDQRKKRNRTPEGESKNKQNWSLMTTKKLCGNCESKHIHTLAHMRSIQQ